MKTKVQQLISAAIIMLVKMYQHILSPILGAKCRYTPSCSAYAIEAIKKHSTLKGGWLAIKRILSCNPWGGTGYDPVP